MKQNVKVIFCLNRSFTNRDYKRFGCAYLEKKGYVVELWNIDGDQYRNVEIPKGYYQGENLRNVSLRKAKRKISKYADAVFVLFNNPFTDFMRYLKKYSCRTIMFLSPGSLEYILPEIPKRSLTVSNDRIFKIFMIKFKNLLLRNYMLEDAKCIADYYILNTHQRFVNYLQYVDDDRIVYMHTGDYDKYLEAKYAGIDVSEELILYIDSGFGLIDIDSMMYGYKDPWREKPRKHAKRRNRIFERLEEHYGLPVVIAGHPHTDYRNADFGGRKIVFDQTCEMTAKAKFVITEWSTAVSFVLLFGKPIMVLNDDDMIRHQLFRKLFWANYKLFDLKVCNMDVRECQDMPWEYMNVIDQKMREKYIHAFIKEEGTPEILSYEMLERVIEKIIGERAKAYGNSV